MKIQCSYALMLACSFGAAACASKSPGPQTAEPQTSAAESNITLCVIDTIAPGGMMQIGAIHVHATNDTLVLQRDGRVPIRRVVAGPKVLNEATWITAKAPLQFTTASGRAQFNFSGMPRVFAMEKIALLGVMRGLPVFALGTEGGPMRAELESFSARGIGLEKALSQSLALRRQMDRVKTLYIPTALVGCTFQTFTRAPARRR